MTALVTILAANAAVSAACFGALWLLSVALRDVSFVDSWWAFGIVVLAVSTAALTPHLSVHGQALFVLTLVWGLRLGFYLFLRWRREGADHRYGKILGRAETEKGWSFGKAALILVFALQAPLQYIVALPAQLGEASPDSGTLGPLAMVGIAFAVAGILFESIGDWQLQRFKRDPANRGKVLDRGLWRYTRHPNYFGDALTWWGLYLVAAETRFGLWSLPGPILITLLLTRWSGVPTVEGSIQRRRPDYADYVRRTSRVVPWFPRRDG